MKMDKSFFKAVNPQCVQSSAMDEEEETQVSVSDLTRITATLLQFASHKCLK